MFSYGVSETITDEQLDDALNTADAVFCRVVHLVDWSWIALEAHIRCMKSDHDDANGGACGPCLRDALLALDREWDRGDQVVPPAEPVWIEDWPAAVARGMSYRKPTKGNGDGC